MTEDLSSVSGLELCCSDVATAGGDRVRVILGLPPAWHGAAAVGPAFTASGVAGDNLVLHHALAEAPAGSVIVAALTGDTPAGHWGELMCVAAGAAGIAGVVVSGTVRDLARIEARRFPVFHRGVGPRPAAKKHAGALACPVTVAGATVSPGDLVVADADGIAVVPHASVDDVLADVAANQRREAEVAALLERGVTTLEALGLP